MKRFLSENLCNKFKSERINLGLTQKEIADELGISIASYCRIENGEVQKIDEKIIDQLQSILNIFVTDTDDTNYSIKKITLRLPQDLYNKLDYFKGINQYTSINSTIINCLNDYITNVELQNYKYQIMDFIEDTILKTYVKTIYDLNCKNENNEKLLKLLQEKYDIDIEQEKEIVKLQILNQQRAKV